MNATPTPNPTGPRGPEKPKPGCSHAVVVAVCAVVILRLVIVARI
jgi:hypothetical protein